MHRSLPPRPDPESDRKRAKSLRKGHAAAAPQALERIAVHHPRLRGKAPAEVAAAPFKLADAQLVVAREYGINSWPRLIALIDFLREDHARREALFLAAAVDDRPKPAADMLAHAPQLADASLQAACATANAARVEALLARNARGATADDGPLGAPPLWTLCWSNLRADADDDEARATIARHLLAAGADPDCSAERDASWGRHRFGALYGAIDNRRPELARVLLEAGADPSDGESLYHAAEHPDTRCIELLLQHGASLEPKGNAMVRALDQPGTERARLLLAAGADVNARCGPMFEHMPLHHVARRGWGLDVVDLLLEHGAELEVKDPEGRTPYQLAMLHGNRAIAEHLRTRGADPATDRRQELVAACVVGDREGAQRVLDGGATRIEDLDETDHAMLVIAAGRGFTEGVQLMLDLGFPLETVGGEWWGPGLTVAAGAGHPETMQVFLDRGADPELENRHGGTALGAVAWLSTHWGNDDVFARGRTEAQRQRALVECVDRLVAAGAAVHDRHVVNASPEVAEALRRHGASG